ncbi:MAG TPA: RidA family protein [Candidatus Binataceae bacterium]|nr:RidA family protein [Candidatus Binataceae bacterium]
MAVKREFLKPSWEAQFTYSPAVITEGGRTVWLAGQVGIVDDNGKPITDFDAQVRQALRNVGKVVARAGGDLKDIVTMTVFISDARNSQRFTTIRGEFFPKDFPASALLTAAGFAAPEIMVEIQSVAVIDK